MAVTGRVTAAKCLATNSLMAELLADDLIERLEAAGANPDGPEACRGSRETAPVGLMGQLSNHTPVR
jgi:hypothetical protein